MLSRWSNAEGPDRIGILLGTGLVLGIGSYILYATVFRDALPKPFPVHVTGAVSRPDTVVDAGEQMIVADAIEEAGGALPTADLSALNLAAKLKPNTQLYVPEQGERPSPEQLGPYAAGYSDGNIVVDGSSASGAKSTPAAAIRKVNINTASEAELDTLPGIGPATAKAIIEHRNQHGDFKTVDELLLVRGIGEKKLANLKPLCTVR